MVRHVAWRATRALEGMRGGAPPRARLALQALAAACALTVVLAAGAAAAPVARAREPSIVRSLFVRIFGRTKLSVGSADKAGAAAGSSVAEDTQGEFAVEREKPATKKWQPLSRWVQTPVPAAGAASVQPAVQPPCPRSLGRRAAVLAEGGAQCATPHSTSAGRAHASGTTAHCPAGGTPTPLPVFFPASNSRALTDARSMRCPPRSR